MNNSCLVFTSFSLTQVWMSGDKSVHAKQASKSVWSLLDIRKESAAVRFDWAEEKNLLQSVLVPVSTNSHNSVAAAAAAAGSFSQWVSCFLDGVADGKTEISGSLISVLWFYASLPDLRGAAIPEAKLKETPPENPGIPPGRMHKTGLYRLLGIKGPSSGGHAIFLVLEKYVQVPQVENTLNA